MAEIIDSVCAKCHATCKRNHPLCCVCVKTPFICDECHDESHVEELKIVKSLKRRVLFILKLINSDFLQSSKNEVFGKELKGMETELERLKEQLLMSGKRKRE